MTDFHWATAAAAIVSNATVEFLSFDCARFDCYYIARRFDNGPHKSSRSTVVPVNRQLLLSKHLHNHVRCRHHCWNRAWLVRWDGAEAHFVWPLSQFFGKYLLEWYLEKERKRWRGVETKMNWLKSIKIWVTELTLALHQKSNHFLKLFNSDGSECIDNIERWTLGGRWQLLRFFWECKQFFRSKFHICHTINTAIQAIILISTRELACASDLPWTFYLLDWICIQVQFKWQMHANQRLKLFEILIPHSVRNFFIHICWLICIYLPRLFT